MHILCGKASIRKTSPVTRKLEDYPTGIACLEKKKNRLEYKITFYFSSSVFLPAKPSSIFATLLVFVVWFYCQKIWDVSDLCKIDLISYFLNLSCILQRT